MATIARTPWRIECLVTVNGVTKWFELPVDTPDEEVYKAVEAAEQSMHLTDENLRDLLASLTPDQFSALKYFFTKPIGK